MDLFSLSEERRRRLNQGSILLNAELAELNREHKEQRTPAERLLPEHEGKMPAAWAGIPQDEKAIVAARMEPNPTRTQAPPSPGGVPVVNPRVRQPGKTLEEATAEAKTLMAFVQKRYREVRTERHQQAQKAQTHVRRSDENTL